MPGRAPFSLSLSLSYSLLLSYSLNLCGPRRALHVGQALAMLKQKRVILLDVRRPDEVRVVLLFFLNTKGNG